MLLRTWRFWGVDGFGEATWGGNGGNISSEEDDALISMGVCTSERIASFSFHSDDAVSFSSRSSISRSFTSSERVSSTCTWLLAATDSRSDLINVFKDSNHLIANMTPTAKDIGLHIVFVSGFLNLIISENPHIAPTEQGLVPSENCHVHRRWVGPPSSKIETIRNDLKCPPNKKHDPN